MNKILKPLLKTLNKNEFCTEQSLIRNYCIDWRGKFKGTAEVLFFPKNVKSVIKIMKFCFKNSISIVPQGGNTSLVGGSVPRVNKGEVILNLSKLNKIREIDPISNTVTLEGGCILQDANDKLEPFGLEMPISLGSKGSCQIGGNIATNAGGLNVIKYGSIRSNILGIEAVLPNGELHNDLKTVKKNNTGFDLKQLLIGSEGTLGIITAATLKIYKKPSERIVLILSTNKINETLEAYRTITKNFGELITAFELMNKFSVNLSKKLDNNLKLPFSGDYYCLIELTNFLDIKNFNNFIIDKFGDDSFKKMKIIIAKSESENKIFWRIREEIPLAEKLLKNVIQHDVSLPLNLIDKFIEKSSSTLKKLDPKISIINFGHLGDNNLHFNVFVNKILDDKEYKKIQKNINRIVFSNVIKFNGSISAEHGIGQLRRKELKKFKSDDEIKKMVQIKKIFDPKGIMNPGKII